MSMSGGPEGPNVGRRILIVWGVLVAIAVPLVVVLLGPHLPPGNASVEAGGQRTVNTWLTALAVAVMLGVIVYFASALVVFRDRGTEADGPPILGNSRLQGLWVGGTSAIVLFAAGLGTYGLVGPDHGSGGGQGPDPLSKPPGQALQVQVIAQQWSFTYRYPSYGGMETTELVLPVNSTVELHVTSLDVIHSFWAYELGVKADAVNGADNIAYVRPRHIGAFAVRCAELCGLWHAQMSQTGRVLSPTDFATWAQQQEQLAAPISKYLPPYSTTYYPDPPRRAG